MGALPISKRIVVHAKVSALRHRLQIDLASPLPFQVKAHVEFFNRRRDAAKFIVSSLRASRRRWPEQQQARNQKLMSSRSHLATNRFETAETVTDIQGQP